MTDSSLTTLIESLEREAQTDRDPIESPDIGIIMGSDSDLDTVMGTAEQPGAYDTLAKLGFAELTDYDNPPDCQYTFETYVVSAHRTPSLLYTYASTASARGLSVIIAAAGGKAADLPNMTASIAYPLPVIGLPVHERSIPSVIGMPTGVPILTVDAGKSINAALGAVQLLSVDDEVLRDRLVDYRERLETGVANASRSLHELGSEDYGSEG